MRNTDWDFEFMSRNLEQSYSFFESTLMALVNQHVPSKPPTKVKLPWNKDLPLQLKTKRTKAWTDYKIARQFYGRQSPQAYDGWFNYCQSNNEIKIFKIDARRSYEQNLLADLNENPKKFHAYLRSQKVNRPRVGPLQGQISLTDDPKSMAEIFVKSFYDVLAPHTHHFPHDHQDSVERISNVHFTPLDVVTRLQNLDAAGSSGPDLIHPSLLKTCRAALSTPLYLLFKKSLTTMSVPSSWKLSNITPIFKKGSHADPLNYRPISLTSVASKIMERIITGAVRDHLEENNLLSDSQFGFRPGRSVQDQLLLTYNSISADYDAGQVVELLLFDFKKAFDLVPHTVILDKLVHLGFRNPLLGWIADFLRDRTMRVVVCGARSSSRPVISGVPQGSVIGPLLFNIFVNYLAHDTASSTLLFADDLKLYLSSSRDLVGYADMIDSIQSDINLIRSRASSWGLIFSPQKCVRLRFVRPFNNVPPVLPLFIGDELIRLVGSSRDLDVLVDTDLRFHSHIRMTASKAYGVSNNILRGTICRSPEFMRAIFISHVRPIIDFCSPVWNLDFIGDTKALESVQRHWTKQIEGYSEIPYFERLRGVSLFSVWGRLLRADLVLVWKILQDPSHPLRSLLTLSDGHRTRGHQFKLSVFRSATEARRRFFSNRVIARWNNLPSEVVTSPSLSLFKSRLHDYLGDLLYYYHDDPN